MPPRNNTQNFIDKANKKHNNRYTYDKTVYTFSRNDIISTCSLHGDFTINANKHLSGRGCQKCGEINRSVCQRKSQEQFITESILIHGDRYDYSKVVYIGSQSNVIIICIIHGEFPQLANNHLCGQGCDKCGKITMAQKQTKSHETFINECIAIHGDKYEYHELYINNRTPINIWCKIHKKYFKQRPNDHIHGEGQGCYDCGRISMAKLQTKSQELYIEQCNKVHNNFYTYQNLVYITTNKKVNINCPLHGIFPQRASAHLRGQGCPCCKEYKSEKLCREIMEEILNVKFQKERPKFLGRLELDGYNEDEKLAFEYNGKQHDVHIPFFHKTEQQFLDQQERDIRKRRICINQGIKLITIPYKYSYLNPKRLRNFIIQELEKLDVILYIRFVKYK